jgi:two-component system chemotaxis sensor kinase CheA
MDLDFEPLLQMFLAESAEGLSAMEQALVALEARPEDEETLGTIFRVAHTLKGNASSFGFQGVTEFAHVLEDVLDRLRSQQLPVTAPLVTLLLRSVDALRQMVPDAVSGTEGMQPAHRALLTRLAEARTAIANTEEPSPEEDAATEGRALVDRRWSQGRRREDLERDRTLRVDIDKLDRMMNLTGEIAVTRGRLKQLLADVGGLVGEEILEAHGEADRLAMDLQELVMKVRMVSLGPVFRQYIRTVRDVAAAHGRQARLLIEGEDVEVDTTVVEHIRDPLTHMIRNALDHGIEPPEVRMRQGKDPCGSVTLRAHREAGSIVIQLSDDGAGLDRDRIVARARALGMVAAPETLPVQELFRLVLEPGFSTAEAVTDLSGRGIGLDVVRRNIEGLRGSVGIQSREGEGTTITLRLPLTLAIIAGFAVGVGGETYVIPLDDVVECLELPREACPHTDGHGVLSLRGEALPYLRLREVFGVGGVPAGREHVVVVRHDGGEVGIAVDVLYGESQTVIKPLGRLFLGLQGIAGSAILGSGRVALILDTPSLLRRVTEHVQRAGPTGGAHPDQTLDLGAHLEGASSCTPRTSRRTAP